MSEGSSYRQILRTSSIIGGASVINILFGLLPTKVAAVLRVKLTYLDEWNARRAALAGLYCGELAGSCLVLPYLREWADSAWHLFVTCHPQRDALHQRLTEAGIGSLIQYPVPPHKRQAYADSVFMVGAFPLASRMATEVLSLPIGQQLTTGQADAVVAAVHGAVQTA